MMKLKLATLTMGNTLVCVHAFWMIAMAVADSRVLLDPGTPALVVALVLFVMSCVNMVALYEIQEVLDDVPAGEGLADVSPEEIALSETTLDRPLSEQFLQIEALAEELARPAKAPRRRRRARRRRPAQGNLRAAG